MIKLHQQSWNKDSYLTGTVNDKYGRVQFEITGSWRTEVFLKNSKTNEIKSIWKVEEMPPDVLQNFGFT